MQQNKLHFNIIKWNGITIPSKKCKKKRNIQVWMNLINTMKCEIKMKMASKIR